MSENTKQLGNMHKRAHSPCVHVCTSTCMSVRAHRGRGGVAPGGSAHTRGVGEGVKEGENTVGNGISICDKGWRGWRRERRCSQAYLNSCHSHKISWLGAAESLLGM